MSDVRIHAKLKSDDLSDAYQGIQEAAALAEVASRVEHWQTEDVEMLTTCSRVTWRLLEAAKSAMQRYAEGT